MTPATTPPRARLQSLRCRLRLAREECMQLQGSLIWVFLFQPLSTQERSSHRKWALASLTRTPGEAHWQLRYRSPTEGTRRVLVYRPHMADAPIPPTIPRDDRYTYDWTDPLSAVWFHAARPANGRCLPPPCSVPTSSAAHYRRDAKSAHHSCVQPPPAYGMAFSFITPSV